METINNASQRELKRLVDQIERLSSERDGIAKDIKDKLTEAKSAGFDAAIIKKVLAIRKAGKVAWEEQQALIETYLGALEGTPLGNWAEGKAKLAAVS